MKFSEMEYHRIDAKKFSESLKELTCRFASAASAKEQYQLILEEGRLLEEFYTMNNLVYIRYTLDTGDTYYAEEMQASNEIAPLIQEAQEQFEKAMLESPYLSELKELTGEYLFERLSYSKKSFSPDIVGLLQEEGKLAAEYQAVLGAAKIPFQGKDYSIAEMGKFGQDDDREIRRAACEATGNYYESIHETFDSLSDKLVKNRTMQAKKLGLSSYVDLAYLRHERCFTLEDARKFRELAIRDVLPAVQKLKDKQAKRIGVKALQYYDINYRFPDGNPMPLGSSDDTLAAGKQMYTGMSAQTAEFIKVLYDQELLDVLARPGKTMSGYCASLPSYKCPFIFANFNGTASDVEVLTHEAGHAYAFYTGARTIELDMLRSPTAEACEVHSMSMEFFAQPWYGLFFGNDTQKYTLAHLDSALDLILRGCQMDHFQEEVYLHPEMTPEERNGCWKRLEVLYRPYLHSEGIPFFEKGADWQRIHHFFTHPYYYIDYSMAQTIAFQFWMEMEKDWKQAWEKYNTFVSLGGQKNFFDLVKSVGLSTPIEDGCMERIAGHVSDVLEKLE